MSDTVFDHRRIEDAAIRDQYDRLLRRGRTAAEAVTRAYAPEGATFDVRFVHRADFNASVRRAPGGYEIALHASVPILIRVLFDRLLSDPRLLPELGAGNEPIARYGLDFIADPSHLDARTPWSISLDAHRAHAARLLSEMAMTYVMLHELGHVMCGHVEADEHFHGPNGLQELVVLSRRPRLDPDRRQAWEYDADAVATTLLINFIDELVHDTTVNLTSASVFGHGEHTREQVIALAAVTLFALFAYLRGAERTIEASATHPHPLTRAFYLKDMLFHAANARTRVSQTVLEGLLDTRIDEMFVVLEALELVNDAEMTEAYLGSIEKDRLRVGALQVIHRLECARWSWVPEWLEPRGAGPGELQRT